MNVITGRRLLNADESPEGLYYTMGRHDVVAIVEAPNDETIASVLYSTGSLGNIRTETLSIFNVRSS